MGETDDPKAKVVIYFDEYTRDYAFYSQVNGARGAVLFSRGKPLDTAVQDRFRTQLAENDEIIFDEWYAVNVGALPVATWRNPRLFAKNYNLTGTLSGSIDPFLLFGVHGALVSGKIAALAVTDVPAHANATAQARGLDGHEELSHDGTSRRRQVLRPHPRVRKTLIARSRASLRLFRGIFPGYRRGQRHMLGRGGRATSLCNSGFVMVDYFGFICVSAICSLMQSAIDRIPCGTCDNPVV